MRIFHGVVEIAGQIGNLCKGLRQAGHVAQGYNTFQTYLGYRDHIHNVTHADIQLQFPKLIHEYDLFHYHLTLPIYPNGFDFKLLKAFGKKAVMHHWGNDVRFHSKARARNPYVYTGDSPPEADIHARLKLIGKQVRTSIVQDYEVRSYVRPYFDKVHVLPLAIDLDRFTPVYPDPKSAKPPLIIHAPTNPLFKGTHQIERAIDSLRSRHTFEYRRVEHLNHEEAARLYREADLIVDQILCGSYGLFSVEAMALGKPVVCYIREDLVPTFPEELPIINANPDTIAAELSWLLDNRDSWPALGRAGRKYVERRHAIGRVTKKLLAIYQSMG